MARFPVVCSLCLAILCPPGALGAVNSPAALTIPEVKATAKRLMTVDDILALRVIDTLSVSPDRRHFAIFVRQADSAANAYRGGWFVGNADDGSLIYVGQGGELSPGVRAGDAEVSGGESRWSPDGNWIVYTLEIGGELQLWRSRIDGSAQEQVTQNASDVLDFAFSDDGRALYFTVEVPSRSEQKSREDAKARAGYNYDEDLWSFKQFMSPPLVIPGELENPVWTVTLDDKRERLANASEREEFARIRTRSSGGQETVASMLGDDAVQPVTRRDGARAWLERSTTSSSILRVKASLPSKGQSPMDCHHDECVGAIRRVWWSEDGKRALFWRGEGINNRVHAVYAWSPSDGTLITILRAPDDEFQQCDQVARNRLLCVRETPTQPQHLATIDLRSGAIASVADVNPEFRNIRFGKVERVEWDTPKFAWNEPGGKLAGLYPSRAYGYILYPPDFDPTRKYPVFIEPYIAHGFISTYISEHPLHVYAANGFVVLNFAFPAPIDVVARLGADMMSDLYSAELDFPHLNMLMESTVRGLDTVAARGFVDERRVGIGGVSHGSFVPMYMMQKHDRIAAISIASPGWGGGEYYAYTRSGRDLFVSTSGKVGYRDWMPRPDGAGKDFWSRIDIADHVDSIEAPILFQLAAGETYGALRLLRHLDDAGKPYDAYVFTQETHIKWQPAHLQAVMNRNLDWFRFWLQGSEDPAPAKAQQYVRWRALQKLRTSPSSGGTN